MMSNLFCFQLDLWYLNDEELLLQMTSVQKQLL